MCCPRGGNRKAPAVGGRDSQLGVDLDGDHVAGAEPLREQDGIVAGAGPDLQDPLTRLGPTVGQHPCHDLGMLAELEIRAPVPSTHTVSGMNSAQHTASNVGCHSAAVIDRVYRDHVDTSWPSQTVWMRSATRGGCRFAP
jgi:hypothetical protein